MGRNEPIRRVTQGAGASASEIPDKLYFRIGEVARICEVPTYVLRFWESEFPQLKPNKGGTGQRLYRRRDVEMALRVKTLLKDEGYTISGARQLLQSELKQKEPQIALAVAEPSPSSSSASKPSGVESSSSKPLLGLRRELESLAALLAKPAVSQPNVRLAAPSVSSGGVKLVAYPIEVEESTAPVEVVALVQPIRARLSEAAEPAPAHPARGPKRERLGPSLIGSLFDEADSIGDGK
ncbi:MAG: MerR family transcriptional regulator [Acidobacteriaceae bacterium]|nr:MerR family transcriptional regulator [Acidobacteriaceae bacterium]